MNSANQPARLVTAGALLACASMFSLATSILVDFLLTLRERSDWFADMPGGEALNANYTSLGLFALVLVNLSFLLDMGSRIALFLGRKMGRVEESLGGWVGKSVVLTLIFGIMILFNPYLYPNHTRFEVVHLGQTLLFVTNLLFAIFWSELADHLSNARVYRWSVGIFWAGLALLPLVWWQGANEQHDQGSDWGAILSRFLALGLAVANGGFLWFLRGAICTPTQNPDPPLKEAQP